MTITDFRPARQRRAFDDIVAQVREGILAGVLRAGERLPAEREMAGQLAVSRNTLREALRMLEVAGLIERRRGASGGAFITNRDLPAAATRSGILDLSRFSLTDLREARSHFAGIVVPLVCERADEAMLDRLEENIDEADAISAYEADRHRRAIVNLQFHQLLAEATGNPVIEEMMAPVMEIMRQVVLVLGPTEDDTVISSRRRLLSHLRRRDAAAALAEMNAYLAVMHDLWVSANYEGAGPVQIGSVTSRVASDGEHSGR